MKNNETKETKPVSFRLPMEVFTVLQSKGEGMELSAHEVASKIVQDNYQEPIAIQGKVVKEPVTCSKKLVLREVNKHVFHFTLKDLRKIFSALTQGGYLPSYVCQMQIGEEYNGLTRVGDDLWEVLIET
ncbi:MAG TPA: hypothetical protein VF411_13625, partial [Bacteroidia bacterium]